MMSRSVGFVEVCGVWAASSGKFSVSPLNILANVFNDFVLRSGLRASNPWSFLIASNRSFVTLVAESIGVSIGSSQCCG